MKQTHYLTTTVQPGSRLDIALDDLTVGQTVEVIVIIQKPDQPPKAGIDRRAFMKLPMAERRQLLATQAEAMREHYEQDLDWQDWVNLDVGVTYDEP